MYSFLQGHILPCIQRRPFAHQWHLSHQFVVTEWVLLCLAITTMTTYWTMMMKTCLLVGQCRNAQVGLNGGIQEGRRCLTPFLFTASRLGRQLLEMFSCSLNHLLPYTAQSRRMNLNIALGLIETQKPSEKAERNISKRSKKAWFPWSSVWSKSGTWVLQSHLAEDGLCLHH